MDGLNKLANEVFAGKIVRKDLTKQLKESKNVPIYVLEYLLGMYCATNDDNSILDGIAIVKKILSENYVRPDEAEKVKFKISEKGSFTVIDKLTVTVDIEKGSCFAELSNLGLKKVPISPAYVKEYEKLLIGGIWCIVKLGIGTEEDVEDPEFAEAVKQSIGKKKGNDLERGIVMVEELTPIQMPNLDLKDIFEGRKSFEKLEWMDLLLRSIGMEPTRLEEREKWLILIRLVPLIEANYNLVELGPRSTGKSHIYKEISPNSILVSGGQTTVANLFYNMGSKKMGLVGLWDCVAFDEVAGINIKDKDGIQIMKDYMNSGSFNRGRDLKAATASMVFLGNINQSVDVLLKTSNLFQPFPEQMAMDTAFFDRIHFYLPGWEVPKFSTKHFTDEFGFITDYISEFFREMRKRNYSDAFDRYFRLGNNINQRDSMAIRKTVSGLVKLIYPNGEFTKEDIEEILIYALEGRRRVKEQLKRIGGMEFYAVNFSYIDNESLIEKYVGVKETGSGKLIAEGTGKAGSLYTVARSDSGVFGVYKIEAEMVAGNGKFERKGVTSNQKAKENLNTAFSYFKANKQHISGGINSLSNDFLMDICDLQGIGQTSELSLSAFVSLCSTALQRPVISQTVILGTMTLGGTINRIEELANMLQVAHDAGATKILIPSSSKSQIADVPDDLFTKFQIIFYKDPEEAVFKALGVE